MDSITQATLGAAVGHICLQDKLGRKGLIAGAMLGTLPDLDILIYPFLDEVQRLYWHRGESHSVWFLLLGSIGIGWLLRRRYKERNIEIVQATTAVFLILSTHVLIDLFTVYGTQLFAPVSRTGFALNNMFIIDPLFTLPLFLGVIGAVLIQQQTIAHRVNAMGLLLAGLYAVWSFTAQSIADEKFRSALADDHIFKINRQITSPAPFNTLLWRHIVETPEGFLLGYWSWFDAGNQKIHFTFIPQNSAIVEKIRSTRAFTAVDWFSKGWWFALESDNKTAKVVDVRFTEIPESEDQPYTKWQWPFAWNFNIDDAATPILNPVRPQPQEPRNTLVLFYKRILGKGGWGRVTE